MNLAVSLHKCTLEHIYFGLVIVPLGMLWANPDSPNLYGRVILYFNLGHMQLDTEGIDDSAAVTLLGVDSTPFSKPVTALQTYQARPAELSPLSPFTFHMLFAKEKAPDVHVFSISSDDGTNLFVLSHSVFHETTEPYALVCS